MGGPQPIATAPKDGTRIIGLYRKPPPYSDEASAAWWNTKSGSWAGYKGVVSRGRTPDYWLPFPELPRIDGEGE